MIASQQYYVHQKHRDKEMLNKSVYRFRYTSGLVTSSIHKRHVTINKSQQVDSTFIPPWDFYGPEMPLNKTMRALTAESLIMKGELNER